MPDLRLKIPPVLVALLVGAAMWAVARAAPTLRLDFPGRTAGVHVLAWTGGLIAAVAVARFIRARTTVHPTRPGEASVLVTSGIYRFTRNPMYLGLALLLAAWALRLASPLAFLLLPVFVIYMNRFQIAPEEEALRRRFGDAFVDYSQRVRRWL